LRYLEKCRDIEIDTTYTHVQKCLIETTYTHDFFLKSVVLKSVFLDLKKPQYLVT